MISTPLRIQNPVNSSTMWEDPSYTSFLYLRIEKPVKSPMVPPITPTIVSIVIFVSFWI